MSSVSMINSSFLFLTTYPPKAELIRLLALSLASCNHELIDSGNFSILFVASDTDLKKDFL